MKDKTMYNVNGDFVYYLKKSDSERYPNICISYGFAPSLDGFYGFIATYTDDGNFSILDETFKDIINASFK